MDKPSTTPTSLGFGTRYQVLTPDQAFEVGRSFKDSIGSRQLYSVCPFCSRLDAFVINMFGGPGGSVPEERPAPLLYTAVVCFSCGTPPMGLMNHGDEQERPAQSSAPQSSPTGNGTTGGKRR